MTNQKSANVFSNAQMGTSNFMSSEALTCDCDMDDHDINTKYRADPVTLHSGFLDGYA